MGMRRRVNAPPGKDPASPPVLRSLASILAGCILLLNRGGADPGHVPKAASRQVEPGCQGCGRRAYVGEADAGATDVALRESLISRLAEALTSPCFHLVRSEASEWGRDAAGFGAAARPPEYVFTGRYEEDLNAKGRDGAAVMSRLTVSLFYDGEPREQVGTWTVTSPVNSFTACTNRMFKNEDAVMKSVRPIEALLEDFERRPASCAVHPAKKDLAAGETMDIMVVGLKDWRGREAKPFNRIVVEADRGRVLGGEAVDGRPRARAFQVGDGLIELRYQAPGGEASGGEVIVAVRDSCDAARPDLWPLAKTGPGRKIGECRFNVHGGVGPGTVVYRRTVAWDSTSSNPAGSTTYRGSLTEEVSVRVGLKYTNTYRDRDYYKSEAAAASYSYSYRNDVLLNGKKADVLSESVEDSGTFGPEDSASVLLTVDRKSGAYTLEIGLRSREKQGRGSWFISVNTLPELLRGAAEGRTVKGSYAAPGAGPATWPGHRSNQGNDPGTSFNWNLALPDRR